MVGCVHGRGRGVPTAARRYTPWFEKKWASVFLASAKDWPSASSFWVRFFTMTYLVHGSWQAMQVRRASRASRDE